MMNETCCLLAGTAKRRDVQCIAGDAIQNSTHAVRRMLQTAGTPACTGCAGRLKEDSWIPSWRKSLKLRKTIQAGMNLDFLAFMTGLMNFMLL